MSNISGKTKVFSPLFKIKKESDFYWGPEQHEAFDAIKRYLTKSPILLPPSKKKNISLYIFASDTIIGSMLAQENINGVKRSIYYLSRVLVDAETRYSLIEKLCICLYFACMKLKQYIKLVDVYISSHYDIIKHMLSKPIMYSRIGKWAPALTEFSLTFKPLKAMKGQIVADFIEDHTMVESFLNMVDTKPWRLYFDGSSHKDGTRVGVLILSLQDDPTKFKYKISEKCSNNEAEYEALIIGLRLLKGLEANQIEVRGDSELVFKQVTREYKCIKESLLKYFVTAMQLLEHFEVTDIRHVPRNKNQEANKLAQISYGYKMSN
ncbi:uncharacterized protein LOC127078941 [Lathyrus oleraceus]|uniref:uncharacterized protein LOC127078941 n=1 Tax=Pisum sativum TaxID=3888 RepID=UPI0021CE00F9|nr:uncharacterized protein LOC127078941 [Pisum sativum]